MKCDQCGARLASRRENYMYEESGLPGITLMGIEIRRCAKCGDFEVVIPRIEELHRRIALAITKKCSRLTPAEIRFLRKSLGWSGADFSAHFGVTPETVSRWENGQIPMGVLADRLLRLMVVHLQPAADYSLDILKSVATEKASPLKLGMKAGPKGWSQAA
ncbi:MAG: helix-turn-helix domain-containing protein [Acidobacteria bacterium]|nr:helix-turn-helix domain-containing protein [Acidobacteriota bacterium]